MCTKKSEEKPHVTNYVDHRKRTVEDVRRKYGNHNEDAESGHEVGK